MFHLINISKTVRRPKLLLMTNRKLHKRGFSICTMIDDLGWPWWRWSDSLELAASRPSRSVDQYW